MSLTDALDELIESGHIAPHLARKVVEEVRPLLLLMCCCILTLLLSPLLCLIPAMIVRQSSFTNLLKSAQEQVYKQGQASDISFM